MQWLLDNIPELRFEIDLGWTEYTGHDSIGILKRYPERFALLHFKEIARGGVAWTDKPFCTAPGGGNPAAGGPAGRREGDAAGGAGVYH